MDLMCSKLNRVSRPRDKIAPSIHICSHTKEPRGIQGAYHMRDVRPQGLREWRWYLLKKVAIPGAA